MSDDQRADGKFLFGFFVGGLIGALTIFFLGTKEGKKTGKLLHDKGEELIDDVQDKISDLEKKGEDTAAEKLESALAHIEALQEHGRQTTANLRKRIFKNLPKKR